MATHRFTPTAYHNVIATLPPVLTIGDGDSVVTTTIDARGFDERNRQCASGPNPMTGPFFIEGAEPGDALMVRIERMTPTRPTGWTASALAANVVDPDFVTSLPERLTVDWAIDAAAGTVRLVDPPEALKDFSLPLAPMIGCFGVAPAAGQAIFTATSAENGGNMDYRRFAPGTVAAFPVFVPGALFFLGDGHACQGDGEIVGTGIETSFEIAFTVKLRKRAGLRWPRGETADFIFTVGNARPLDQALQHATTEMMRWLEADFGLDLVSASHLLGQVVRYDIGNVYDPAYTVACRLPKRLLKRPAQGWLGIG